MEQSVQQPEPWRGFIFRCEGCKKDLTHTNYKNDALFPFASNSIARERRIPKEALLSAWELSQLDDIKLEAHLSAQKGPLRCNECWFKRTGLDHVPSRFELLEPICCMEFHYPPREPASQEQVILPTGMVRCVGCFQWQLSDRYRGPRVGAGFCGMCPGIHKPLDFIKVEWRDLGKKSYRVMVLPKGVGSQVPCIDWHKVVYAEPSIKKDDKEGCKGLFRQWEVKGDPLRVWAALFHLREYFGNHRGELEELFHIIVEQNTTFSRRSYLHRRLQRVLTSLQTDPSNKAADWVFSGEREQMWQVFSRVMAQHCDQSLGVELSEDENDVD
ncbi:unnamed protein product [Clonostachys rosea]|uniref:Uncharacterized protein n=1 Tax=Bionectria ochroleuca TaxID=29856 RepID=A0ABY6UZ97_BIOOC|nr:unnamed protein product [Clonostachys rosea]